LNGVLQVLYQLDAKVMLWDVCCLLCCAAGVVRYATLPNIMKAKKKPISSTTPQQLGVMIENQLSTKKVSGHACCMSLQPPVLGGGGANQQQYIKVQAGQCLNPL
jgi:hypothetical protein